MGTRGFIAKAATSGVKPAKKIKPPPITLHLNDFCEEWYKSQSDNPLAVHMTKTDWKAIEIGLHIVTTQIEAAERWNKAIPANTMEQIIKFIDHIGSSVPSRMRLNISTDDSDEGDDEKKAAEGSVMNRYKRHAEKVPENNVTHLDEYFKTTG